MTGHQPQDALLAVLTEPLLAQGLDLEDIEVSSAGRRRLVRVLVDKDGGISLDDIAGATTVVGKVLDEADVLGDASYTLEVTSPGVDRPLTQPRHWRRNVDRLVKVKGRDGETFTGRVTAATESGVVLNVDGVTREVGYSSVATARVQVEFNRPAARPKSDKG